MSQQTSMSSRRTGHVGFPCLDVRSWRSEVGTMIFRQDSQKEQVGDRGVELQTGVDHAGRVCGRQQHGIFPGCPRTGKNGSE